jgi:hypothetical protein
VIEEANDAGFPEAELELKKLPYRSLLGAGGYLATSTMPSVSYASKELARFFR